MPSLQLFVFLTSLLAVRANDSIRIGVHSAAVSSLVPCRRCVSCRTAGRADGRDAIRTALRMLTHSRHSCGCIHSSSLPPPALPAASQPQPQHRHSPTAAVAAPQQQHSRSNSTLISHFNFAMSSSDKSVDLKRWSENVAKNMAMFKEGAEMMVRDHQSQWNTRAHDMGMRGHTRGGAGPWT